MYSTFAYFLIFWNTCLGIRTGVRIPRPWDQITVQIFESQYPDSSSDLRTAVRIPRPTVGLGIRTFCLFVQIPRHLFCPDTESPHLVRIPNPDVIDRPYTETPVYCSSFVKVEAFVLPLNDLKKTCYCCQFEVQLTDLPIIISILEPYPYDIKPVQKILSNKGLCILLPVDTRAPFHKLLHC